MSSRSFSGLVIVCITFCYTTVWAETIAIIGTGDVAGALGPEFALQGHRIVYGSRQPGSKKAQELVATSGKDAAATTPGEAVIGADVVVLAIPGTLASEIVAGLGDLSGKIVVDPTNPMTRKLQKFQHATDTSNTRLIQDIAPEAYVVKAFNTLGWKTMIDPETAGGPVSVPLAGESDSAKKFVATLVTGMGLEPIDVGGVENAHWLEGMAILLLNNRYGTRESFDFHLRRTD